MTLIFKISLSFWEMPVFVLLQELLFDFIGDPVHNSAFLTATELQTWQVCVNNAD